MKRKKESKISKLYRLEVSVLLWLVIGFIGFLEAGVLGFLTAFTVGALLSILTLLGFVPFIGFFLYSLVGGWFNSLIASTGVSIPIAQTIAFWFFFILAFLLCSLTTLLTLLLILN